MDVKKEIKLDWIFKELGLTQDQSKLITEFYDELIKEYDERIESLMDVKWDVRSSLRSIEWELGHIRHLLSD